MRQSNKSDGLCFSTGRVFTFGAQESGKLGMGDSAQRFLPAQVISILPLSAVIHSFSKRWDVVPTVVEPASQTQNLSAYTGHGPAKGLFDLGGALP